MNFLLAARRESATTTWKKGRLFAPPRRSRITTIWKDSATAKRRGLYGRNQRFGKLSCGQHRLSRERHRVPFLPAISPTVRRLRALCAVCAPSPPLLEEKRHLFRIALTFY